MKKLLLIVICATLSFGISSGCSNGNDETPSDESNDVSVPTEEVVSAFSTEDVVTAAEVGIDEILNAVECASVYTNEDRSIVQVVGVEWFFDMNGDGDYYAPFCVEVDVASGAVTEDAHFDESLTYDKEAQRMISKPSVESYYEDYARISYEKLQNSLYDPDSAKFSFMYTYVHENGIVVVTELNVKNQLGGYAGAKTYAFIWDGDYADVAETPYAEEWVDKCFDVAAEYYPLAVTWDVADF